MSNVSGFYKKLGPQYSAVSAEDLYHPTLVAVYSIYCDVILVISTILFIFILYTILTKSTKEMKNYKYYLVHQLFWSFMFDLHFGGWKPVTLWPYYLGYSVGWFSSLSKEWTILPLVGMSVVSVGMGFALYISALHRYVHASPFSTFFHLYSKLWIRMSVYVVIFVTLQCSLAFPFYIFRADSDAVRETITRNAPYMTFFYDKYPDIFGYTPDLDGGNIILFTGGLTVALFLVILSVVGLYFNYVRILNKNKAHVTVATFHMQKLLFKTICIQIGLAVSMLVLPFASALVLNMFNVKWVSTYAIFIFTLITNHAIVDFFTTIYFIKPYREFTMDCINAVTGVCGVQLFKPKQTVITFNSTTVE